MDKLCNEGNRYGCKQLSEYALWYADYDDIKNFDDFIEFGGWTKPNIKQYEGTHTLCSSGVDGDYKD